MLLCHRVLLSAASTYFAALLSATWSPSCPNNIKHIPVLLSDIDDLPAMTALLKCIYTSNVNLHRSDLAAVAAVNNTGSSAAAAGSSPVQPPTTAAAVAASGCPCTASLQQLLANFHDMCWQELSVRVLRLADQFSVPGALQAAVSNLSCLFSYQLSWPAVLAVLWLPPAVAQQPQLKEVRQMAMNRVTQVSWLVSRLGACLCAWRLLCSACFPWSAERLLQHSHVLQYPSLGFVRTPHTSSC